MHPVALARPQPRQHVTVPLAGYGALLFGFDPATALFTQRGDILHIGFGDGGSIAVQGFFSGGAVRPLPVFLEDGTRMDAMELLALYAPRIALRIPPELSGHTRGGEARPAFSAPPDGSAASAGLGLEGLASLAGGEEPYLAFSASPPEDTSQQNLLPVYQEVEFREGEIIFGFSIYGNLFPLGGGTLLHVHLDNAEGEMLDMDGLIAKLPGMFPDTVTISGIAVTGGADNRILLDGSRLSERKETIPLEGFGTTQFDRYEYRPAPEFFLALYIETILRIAR